MNPGYGFTEKRYDKGIWTITEHTKHYGVVEEIDWWPSFETRIEAVAAIIKKCKNVKYDSWMDNWYFNENHYFIIWDENVQGGPHGPLWTEITETDIDEDEYLVYCDDEELA